jgi:predicted 3-demethylubiquinone-9 3-methyltransferase (glyoxalase superfamily)
LKPHPIYPCLWFDRKAKEAAEFYCRVFPNSRILSDSPIVVTFELNGQKFMGLNGGPMFVPNEAVSFVIDCETQEEIDYYWDTLTANGGEESMCGWLKDKFGIWWQVVPAILLELMADPERSERVVAAFLKMRKFNLAKILSA